MKHPMAYADWRDDRGTIYTIDSTLREIVQKDATREGLICCCQSVRRHATQMFIYRIDVGCSRRQFLGLLSWFYACYGNGAVETLPERLP